MKKVMFFVMLLLSTSMAMAQFGRLEDIGKKQDGNGSGTSTETPGGGGFNIPGMGGGSGTAQTQFIDEAVKDGFFLVKQEYRLEDNKIPGSRYNREGDYDYFGVSVSFMIKMKNGCVTTLETKSPWDFDVLFDEYRDGFTPHMSKTSYLKAGQKEWKSASNVFEPDNGAMTDSKNNFVHVGNAESQEGFMLASGAGKKDVYVVWIVCDDAESGLENANAIRFVSQKMEMNLARGMEVYDIPASTKPNKAVFGIVVEPVYSIGRMDLALVGFVNTVNQEIAEEDDHASNYTCVILSTLLAEVEPAVGQSLTRTENGAAGNNKGKNK